VAANPITMAVGYAGVGSIRENIDNRGEWCHGAGRKEDNGLLVVLFVGYVTVRLLL
jgi:hypothetical protein